MNKNKIGILDPEGKQDNPLTGKPYSHAYKELAKVWSKYPAYEKADEIIQDIEDNQVILIISGTGSGKTVLVPKFALHTLNYKGNVAITLPKQIAVSMAAEFGGKTLDVKVGEEVGYQYRGAPAKSKSDKTKLLYATDGSIVARLLNDPLLKGIDCVIVDEAHERKVQIDFLLYLLKEALKVRTDLKVIIMSATINEKIFRDYYSEFKYKQVNISGRTNYPITSHFLPMPLDYDETLKKGFDILINIMEKDNVKKEGAHDILFFVTSSNEAFDICKRLNILAEKEKGGMCKITCDGDVFCVEVYSGMKDDKKDLAEDRNKYKEGTKYTRKVVIATNVAESSVTIDGIKFVIESGFELKGLYNPAIRARKLDRGLITHAQAKQRMGRAGRTEPGVCYHLYTKSDFETGMERFPEPDIRTSDISNECLRLLKLEKIHNVTVLRNILNNFIEPPRAPYVDDALSVLKELGSTNNGEITKLGMAVADVSNNPILGTSLIFSKLYNCSHEMVKIISMVEASKGNIGEMFTSVKLLVKGKDIDKKRIKAMEERYEKAIGNFRHKYGDHLSILKLYEKFYNVYEKHIGKDQKPVFQWCFDHFVKYTTMIKAVKMIRKIKRGLRREITGESLNLTLSEDIKSLNPDDRILACLIIGHRINTALLNGDTYITQKAKKIKIGLDNNTFLKNKPKNVFYHELFMSMGKANINIVSKIPDSFIKLLE